MRVKDIFRMSKGTRVILTITLSVSVMAIIFALFYYRNLNNSEDPRIRKAKKYLLEFDKVSGKENFYAGILLLDSANKIFKSYPDYESSYEIGVILNNKCSAFIITALYDTSIMDFEKKTLLSIAMKYCDSSISNYTAWITKWDSLSGETIEKNLQLQMDESDPVFKDVNFRKSSFKAKKGSSPVTN